MDTRYAAIGGFYNEEGTELIAVPDDKTAVFAAVEEIMENCPASTVLTDEQVAILRAYLPAIGCDEQTQDENGSLQGKGTIEKSVEGCGIKAKVTANLEVASQWEQHHDRKQWVGNMALTREGDGLPVKELDFSFRYLSIGQNAAGEFIVLYNAAYGRDFTDPIHLNHFNEGGTAEASRIDISKHIQWGFYMHAKCEMRTNEGTLTV